MVSRETGETRGRDKGTIPTQENRPLVSENRPLVSVIII